MYKRFREVKGLMRERIVDDDALNIDSSESADLRQFMHWLRQKEDEIILEVHVRRTGIAVSRNPWQNSYARTAYFKGVRHGRRQLRNAGVETSDSSIPEIVSSDPHRDIRQRMYDTHFSELEGVVNRMNQRIFRALRDSLQGDPTTSEVISAVNSEVTAHLNRGARNLAHAEVVRSHAEATLYTYKGNDVKAVVFDAPPNTSSDDAASNDGREYPIDDAHGVIPLHPRDHSHWLPVTS